MVLNVWYACAFHCYNGKQISLLSPSDICLEPRVAYASSPKIMTAYPQPLILFDGHCHLCSRAVQWVLRYDHKQRFHFAPLQSPVASIILSRFPETKKMPDSFFLVEDGKLYSQSTAALRVARRLSGLWPALYIFSVFPPALRDWVYGEVARNRYRWFGRRDTCWMPGPEWRPRSLDQAAASGE
jgi:predicted DCC family thiol-disulfide oxidoreductase YuxK